jgi:hypothetical protein
MRVRFVRADGGRSWREVEKGGWRKLEVIMTPAP